MKSTCLLTVFLVSLAVGLSQTSLEEHKRNRRNILKQSSITTPLLVLRHGYPIETHQVQTSDGYILTLHRIPYSPRIGRGSDKKPVVFLMHGIFCSSSDWILNGPGKALAYLLSDAGYDVWMGNARGNTYSRQHATISNSKSAFWNFSWHEIGVFDLPAMISYALQVTGAAQLRYFGHSQGTTAFLVLNALYSEYKQYIKSAHLLAPVAFAQHMRGPIIKYLGPVAGKANPWSGSMGGQMEFLPNTQLMNNLGNMMCRDGSYMQGFCANTLFFFCGQDSPHLNKTMLPELLAVTPAGSSMKQLYHYAQLYVSGRFRQFDYGKLGNSIRYRSSQPPDYPLQNIDVPIFLYYSDNDYLSNPADVDHLISSLRRGTVKRAYRMPYTKWNHLDFLWGLHAKELLYDIVMQDMLSL